MTVPQAWQAYRAFRRLPEVVLAAEPEDCESILEGWASEDRFPPGMWTDAYLAAFAVAGGWRLVSFDKGFTRFAGLDFLRLEA